MLPPTPRCQAAALGLIFFFVFSAYDTIQVFAKRLYRGDTGADSTLCVYVLFTVGCLFSSRAVAFLGERLSIAIGVLCYASLVVAGLVNTFVDAQWAILLGGSLLGCGAALLWTAQGSLILSYGANETERGRVFAIFWSLYRAAPLLGGL
jgi:MFS family permease